MKSKGDTEAPRARVLRDANVERAFEVLRRMRAPGTSKSTAADVYQTLRARGLAPRFADEIPRYAMRQACAAAIGREDLVSETRRVGDEPSSRDQDATHACLDSVSPYPPVETSPRASSTSPAPRFLVPKHQRYVPPVERLRATSTGARRAFADEIVRIAVDPVARAALRARVRAARDGACGIRRTRTDRKKEESDESSRRATEKQQHPTEIKKAYDAATRAEPQSTPRASSSTSSVPSDVPRDAADVGGHDRGSSTGASRDETERSARRMAPARNPPAFVCERWRLATASALAALEARDAAFSRRRRTRFAAREKRESDRKRRKAVFLNAVVRVQRATRKWLLRRRQRLAASRVRAFLERARDASEIVRRVRRLTRSVQTIQKLARAAFAKRAHPDQVAAFVEHWDVFERYAHARKLDTRETKITKAPSRKSAFGDAPFSVWTSRRSPSVSVRARDLVPVRLKRPIVERVLRRRRETARRDREEYRKALQAWRVRSSGAEKMNLARAVLRPPDDADRDAFVFAEPPPRLRARRALMHADELARAHAEGERAWRAEMRECERAVQALREMDAEDEEGDEALAG